MAKTRLATRRVASGFKNDIVYEVGHALSSGAGLGDAVSQVLFDMGMRRYGDKVTAMLRRGGVEIDDGQVLDEAVIATLLSRGFDFDFDDISQEGIIAAIDAEIAKRISEETGVQLDSVLGAEAAIAAAIIEGVGGLVSLSLIKRLKDAATWARAGYDRDGKRKVLNALAQRRYRLTNRMVWD